MRNILAVKKNKFWLTVERWKEKTEESNAIHDL